MKQTRVFVAITLLLVSLTSTAVPIAAGTDTFENVELIQANGHKVRETSVRVVFGETGMQVVSRSNGSVIKDWSYDKIRSAEYSYTKNPRWKTGMGLGVASVLFPPLLLVAIPVGFSKHRRHWVTIQTDDDFAVLKVGKGIRKVFMPTFETRTSHQIKAMGDDK